MRDSSSRSRLLRIAVISAAVVWFACFVKWSADQYIIYVGVERCWAMLAEYRVFGTNVVCVDPHR